MSTPNAPITTNTNETEHDRPDDSYCECIDCNFIGKICDFQIDKPSSPAAPINLEVEASMTPTQFIGTISRMTRYPQESETRDAEDAFETLNRLIEIARVIYLAMEKPVSDPTRPNSLTMTDQELTQILAALRHWQYCLPAVANMERYSEYLEDGLTFMHPGEIDELCERINLGPLPAKSADCDKKEV